LLGDLHLPGKAQASAVFDALAVVGCEPRLSERTWQSWFSESPRIPKVDKAKILDTLSSVAIRIPGPQESPRTLPDGTFSKLIHGGLLQSLTAPSRTKKLLPTLLARALEYEPVSPLHLHLDAIDIAALGEGLGDIPWEVMKAIGAGRILEILAARWSPRHGTAYSEFSSDLWLKWQNADDDERLSIRSAYARFKPDLFQHYLDRPARPDWEKLGVGADIAPSHVYKLLFSMAADANFLVADRLTAWSLDLATAALAMHALAWTDRYTTFGFRVTDEMLYWMAFYSLFFCDEEPKFDQFDLIPAMTINRADWCDQSQNTLLQGRRKYREMIEDLGVTAASVRMVAMQGVRANPLSYR
jgi:hypothetical protein